MTKLKDGEVIETGKKFIGFEIDERVAELFKKKARLQHRSTSAAIRRLIERDIARNILK